MEGDADRCRASIEQQREEHTQNEGDGDAEMADRNRGSSPAAHVGGVQLDADDEHEQKHANLTQHLKDRE